MKNLNYLNSMKLPISFIKFKYMIQVKYRIINKSIRFSLNTCHEIVISSEMLLKDLHATPRKMPRRPKYRHN